MDRFSVQLYQLALMTGLSGFLFFLVVPAPAQDMSISLEVPFDFPLPVDASGFAKTTLKNRHDDWRYNTSFSMTTPELISVIDAWVVWRLKNVKEPASVDQPSMEEIRQMIESRDKSMRYDGLPIGNPNKSNDLAAHVQ